MSYKNQKCSHQENLKVSETQKTLSLADAKKIADRLNGYSKIYEKNAEILRKNVEDQQASYFSPQICRYPKYKIPEKARYSYTFKQQYWFKFKKDLNSEQTNNKSHIILLNSKKKRIKELFRLLNPINGIIKIKDISIASIPDKILKIIAPFLEELSYVPEGIDYDQFNIAMNNLINILSVDEKNIFLNTARKKSFQATPFTFKPLINTSSSKIDTTVIDRSVKLILGKQEKNKLETKKKFEKELQECTFSPITTKYSPKKQHSSCWVRYYSPH